MLETDRPEAEAVEIDAARRTVVVRKLREPALVLGSSQKDDVVAPGAEIAVVRRRSGGGAVLVQPGGTLWVDVTVPAGDPLWDWDVRKSFFWLGEAWVEALARIGVAGNVHTGGLESTPWSKLVCFAGLGPGEVTVDGRKVVGLSQRRTRSGSLLQCLALLEWDPAAMMRLLVLPPERTDDAAGRAAGIGARRGPELLDSLLGVLQESHG